MPPSMSEKIFQEIKNAVKTRSEDLLTFQGVERDDFDEIIQGLRKPTNNLERRAFRVHWFPGEKYLKVVIPTKIHESPVGWILNEIQDAIFNGTIPPVWSKKIEINASPEYHNFVKEYQGYTKEADLTIIPMLGPNWDQEALFPSVVLETGWAESAEKLAEDVTLWQVGSGGQVRVVFQLKFYKGMQNRIGARLWMNRATPPTNTFASVKTSTKKYEILPPPTPLDEDPSITFEEFFAGGCPPGMDPKGCVIFGLENLRVIARRRIRARGAVPDE